MTGWFVHTARTLRWAPLTSIAAGSAVVWAITATQGRALPTQVAVLACGAVAGGVPLALDDPAHALLAASPTTERRRLLRRLALVLVPGLVLWLALAATAGRLFDDASNQPSLVALAALALAGVAAMAVTQGHRPGAAVTVGGALPLAWVVSHWYLPHAVDGLTALWHEQSVAVALVAGAAVVVATR
jgi:hypothetical protein